MYASPAPVAPPSSSRTYASLSWTRISAVRPDAGSPKVPRAPSWQDDVQAADPDLATEPQGDAPRDGREEGLGGGRDAAAEGAAFIVVASPW